MGSSKHKIDSKIIKGRDLKIRRILFSRRNTHFIPIGAFFTARLACDHKICRCQNSYTNTPLVHRADEANRLLKLVKDYHLTISLVGIECLLCCHLARVQTCPPHVPGYASYCGVHVFPVHEECWVSNAPSYLDRLLITHHQPCITPTLRARVTEYHQ